MAKKPDNAALIASLLLEGKRRQAKQMAGDMPVTPMTPSQARLAELLQERR